MRWKIYIDVWGFSNLHSFENQKERERKSAPLAIGECWIAMVKETVYLKFTEKLFFNCMVEKLLLLLIITS